MEGTLYKWTNYLSGWQPRWFVLDGGTLSYYDSQEEAWKGCKGSIKISVCEISVHPSDVKRVDLTVPGQQYFYLRAVSTAERQKWLVAMGTAKACLTDNRTKREKEIQESAEALKCKMSKLRLCSELLCQQVSRIRESSLSQEPAAAVEQGEDMASVVSSTCSTFLRTLEECLQIASRTFSADLTLRTPPEPPGTAAHPPRSKMPNNQVVAAFQKKDHSLRDAIGPGHLLRSHRRWRGPTPMRELQTRLPGREPSILREGWSRKKRRRQPPAHRKQASPKLRHNRKPALLRLSSKQSPPRKFSLSRLRSSRK
ncbi:hypothetical protein MATL_G00227330 [Megalops atlanticus]|uniref:PH domain-containing protein n=1 Tax=Megalops atlanticus TaxID=7932 RepID=A0A9D3PHB4_MEGAT|nr:hypothetical protein MATL_G00227330 [Megalops atlanticus]